MPPPSKAVSQKRQLDPFRVFLYICFVGFITLMIVGYSMLSDEEYYDHDVAMPEFHDSHMDDSAAQKEHISEPIVLWWTPFTGESGSYRHCGDVSCFFTVDRHYRNHEQTKVFLWYGSDFHSTDLPLPRKSQHEWGLLHEESPKNNYILTKPQIITLFNHTSTFKRESDFPLTFQYVEDQEWLESKKYLLPVQEKAAVEKKEGLATIVYAQSDCGVPSDRDTYVKHLMKEIAVDSYGGCVHNKDLDPHLVDPLKGMEHEDFYRLLSKYKFALSMENAVCDDYITEKIWRPLMLGVVPIIYGSPKIRDVLPDNHSAIIIEDFQSPKELATYLKFLDENDAEYNKYLHWKSTGITNKFLESELKQRSWSITDTWKEGRSNFVEDFECLVCERVHENIKLTQRARNVVEYIADASHLSCPRPKNFESSNSMIDWQGEYDRLDDEAETVRYFADENIPITKGEYHAKLSEIRSKRKKRWF